MSWKTIIVGYDHTHSSNLALMRAADLAKEAGATLVVTSVAPVLAAAASARGIGPFDPADSPELHRDDLRHAEELLATKHVKAEFDLEAGDPADALAALARRRGADLIVVGSHGRHFLDRLLHGSVSEGVARHAECDVLVVR